MTLFISFKNFEKNAVSGPAVAQRWPTGYILPPIANGGPLASCYLGYFQMTGRKEIQFYVGCTMI